MPDIDTLIATFPEQIQNNALRSAQTALENQNVQQNALKLQQQQAGQNALKSIYSDPANIDPTTGLPRPRALGTLYQTNPALGLDTAEALGRLQEYQSRQQLSDMKAQEYYLHLFKDEVADPSVLFAKQLDEQKGLTKEQKDQMLNSKVSEYIDQTGKAMGVPDSVLNRWHMLKPNIPQWEFQSEMLAKRKEQMVGEDLKESEIVKNRAAANKVTPMLETSGPNKGPITYHPYSDTYTRRDAQGNDEPITPIAPTRVGSAMQGAEAHPMPTPLTANVKQPDGTWKPQGVYRFTDGTVRDANTNAAIPPGNVKIEKAEPISGDALDIEATNHLITGQMPNLGWSSGERNRIINRAGEIAAKYGFSPAQVIGMRASSKADFATMIQLDKQKANIGSFEGTARREGELALALAENGVGSPAVQNRIKKLIDDGEAPAELKSLLGAKSAPGLGPSSAPIVNRWINAGRRAIQGDPDLSAFDAAVTSFKNEYARIMSSPTAAGGAMTTDAARVEADKLINDAKNPAGFKSAVGSMFIGMNNRYDEVDKQYNSARKRLEGLERPEVLSSDSSKGTMKTEPKKSWPLSAFGDAAKNAKDGQTWQNGKYIKRNGQIWEQ